MSDALKSTLAWCVVVVLMFVIVAVMAIHISDNAVRERCLKTTQQVERCLDREPRK